MTRGRGGALRASLVVAAAAAATVSLKGGRWVEAAPRAEYDWTCWLMKASYNCKDDPRRPVAHAWTHVSAANETWAALVGRRGGHFDVAKRLRRCGDATRPANVVVLGNSLMRQVFESMACAWQNRVAGGLVQARGPRMDIAALRAGTRSNASDVVLARVSAPPPPCHGPAPDKWYKGAAVGGGDCGDNAARVDFGDELSIFFVFRPWAYVEPIGEILRSKLGLELAEMDALVCNDFCGLSHPSEKRRHTHVARLRRAATAACPAARELAYVDFGRVRATMQKQMLRDVGFLYGATNAKYDDDGHPCLPGLPDDERDFLFAVLANDGLAEEGLAAEREAEFWNRPP